MFFFQYYAPKLASEKDFESLKLEYDQKISDDHRDNWQTGDWTDDSDQMLLILRTFLRNDGQVNSDVLCAHQWTRAHSYPGLSAFFLQIQHFYVGARGCLERFYCGHSRQVFGGESGYG